MIELPDKIDLNNPEFKQAYDILRLTNANVFLTGKAGTGKSTFLRFICRNLKKEHVVLAPTGVAAVNVGGVTIHSFFQMPLRPVPPDDPEYTVKSFRHSKRFSKRKRKLLQKLELIIIDEVSMVRPDTIDFIDRALRGVRGKRGVPFGGVQLLLVGDIFQLEPVVTTDTKNLLSRYYTDFFFFNALVCHVTNLIAIELNKIYRQSDSKFIDMLDRIRLNKANDDDLKILNSRIELNPWSNNVPQEKFSIILASRRDAASAINSERMEQLSTKEYVFQGTIEDDFPEKILPTDLNLTLKKDAQVMLIRNDKDHRWINGTLARIKEISEKGITIELENGKVENVDKEIWENITYTYDEKEKRVKEQVIGRFIQYPLKAAWALTIHKSQGLTFNNVTIDMGRGAFSAGQTYVALSRCRSLQGLKFINPLKKYDIIVSKGALDFSRKFNDKQAVTKVLKEAEARELSKMAIVQYHDREYYKAVESVWKVNNLTDALSKTSVRRLISRFLSEINRLKNKLEEQEKTLDLLSDEFYEMGKMSMEDKSGCETAYADFEKALRINPCNEKAELGMAVSASRTGKRKEAYEILDRIIKRRGPLYYNACIAKGDMLAEDNDFSRASLNYQVAAKSDPENREPIERLIKLYDRAGLDIAADQWRERLDESGI